MDTANLTSAQRAVLQVLGTAQRNPDTVGYYIGPGTRSFEMLCAAEAEITGETPEAVEARRGALPAGRTAPPERTVTVVTLIVAADEERTREIIEEAREQLLELDRNPIVGALDKADLTELVGVPEQLRVGHLDATARAEAAARLDPAPWRVAVECIVEVPHDEALDYDGARAVVRDALVAVSDHSRGRSVGYEESPLAGAALDALLAALAEGGAR